MKSVKHPIIKAEKQYEDTITHGDLTLLVDSSYRKEHHARQYGVMAANFKDLKKGERVYFHYLSLDGIPQLPPDKWLIAYQMLYCVIRDSQIEMLNKYHLIEMKQDGWSSEFIINPNLKASNTQGTVAYTSSPELERGDTVLFKTTGAFENEIEGKKYYVMEDDDIITKIITKHE